MFDAQHIVAVFLQLTRHIQHRRTRLAVPQRELFEIKTVAVGHRRAEIIASHRLAIVALEIQLHACLKTFFAQESMVHAHHFRAFFIHRHGVEIVHFHIAGGAHRMGSGAGIFGKLVLAQHRHILDAGQLTGAVGGKFLITEDG